MSQEFTESDSVTRTAICTDQNAFDGDRTSLRLTLTEYQM